MLFLQERLVLATLYYATGGPEWKEKDNWLSATHHDDWFGVDTDSSSKYTSSMNLCHP